MAYLLNIESSSTTCSVAISNDNQLIAIKEINNGYTHAENLHVFIQQILHETHLKTNDLNAIAISSGPGSYTGLRIGFSAAKGLAYALNIPLITIDTLKAMSLIAINHTDTKDAIFVPMMDARRMEVYCAAYTKELKEELPLQALILTPENIDIFNFNKSIYFFGDGMPKAKTLLKNIPNSNFIDNISPSSSAIIELAFEKYSSKNFVDVAYAEPNYLKEFFFTTAKI